MSVNCLRGFLQRLTLFLVVLVVGATGCGGDAAASLSQLAVLSTAITQLRNALNDTIGQADQATATRIRQTKDAADETLKTVNGVIEKGSNATTVQREEAARQAFAILGTTSQLVDSSGKEIFQHVNETLAALAATIDAVPFVNIPDTAFAVSPYRLRSDSKITEISVYGYFPSIASDASSVGVTVDGKSVQVKRSVGKFYFELPPDVSKSSNATSEIKIQLPRKSWYSISRPSPIFAKVRLLNATPYSFVVDIRKDNPVAYETVTGKEVDEYADNNRSPHYSAEVLFNNTAPNPARYDASTVQISNIVVVGPPKTHGSKACEDCPDPSGRIVAWTAAAVDIEMSAPGCGAHVVAKGPFNIYHCGGGGSNYTVAFVPVFTGHVKGVEDTLPIQTINLHGGWTQVLTQDLPSDWTNVLVKLSFDDNFDKRETFVAVKRGAPVAASADYDVSVENGNKLLIRTR
jgi:hypothetical protein